MTLGLCFVCAGTGFVIGRHDSTTCRSCSAGEQVELERTRPVAAEHAGGHPARGGSPYAEADGRPPDSAGLVTSP